MLVPYKIGHCDAVEIFQLHVLLVIVVQNIGFTGRHFNTSRE